MDVALLPTVPQKKKELCPVYYCIFSFSAFYYISSDIAKAQNKPLLWSSGSFLEVGQSWQRLDLPGEKQHSCSHIIYQLNGQLAIFVGVVTHIDTKMERKHLISLWLKFRTWAKCSGSFGTAFKLQLWASVSLWPLALGPGSDLNFRFWFMYTLEAELMAQALEFLSPMWNVWV